MRLPKGWTLAGASDHPAALSGEHDAPQDVGTVRVHVLTRTTSGKEPQVFAALAWSDLDGEPRFRELDADDLDGPLPPETVRLDLDGGGCEVWSFGPPIERGTRRAA